jgi:hypothetical protein
VNGVPFWAVAVPAHRQDLGELMRGQTMPSLSGTVSAVTAKGKPLRFPTSGEEQTETGTRNTAIGPDTGAIAGVALFGPRLGPSSGPPEARPCRQPGRDFRQVRLATRVNPGHAAAAWRTGVAGQR